jgi:hypothetical protein
MEKGMCSLWYLFGAAGWMVEMLEATDHLLSKVQMDS